MNPMNVAILTPNSPLRWELGHMLAHYRVVRLIENSIQSYPETKELQSLLRVLSPQIIFIDVTDMEQALRIAREASEWLPGIQIIAFGGHLESNQMLYVMRAGIQEYLPSPLNAEDLRDALVRSVRRLEEKPVAMELVSNVFSFLPAKPGVGASTICMNTAGAIAQRTQNHTGLFDFDMDCGAIDFYMNLEAGFSVRDAAEYGEQIDDTIWQRLLTKVGLLDVLRAGRPHPDRPVNVWNLEAILAFARPRYDHICVDLAAVGSPASMATLRHSNQIFLVTTPEICSLHMTLRTLDVIKEMGLDSRVRVVLNRMDSRSHMRVSQVEDLLGQKVMQSFPNDWVGMQRSMSEGKALLQSGPLAGRYAEFAARILKAETPVKKPEGLFSGIGKLFQARG